MNKLLAFSVSVLISFASLSEELKQLQTSTKMHVKEKVQIRQGGPKIVQPGTRKGAVTIVNTQNRAMEDWIRAVIAYFAKETKAQFDFKNGSFDPKRPQVIGELTVYVIDDPSLPKSLLAPDDRWAAVNIAPIYSAKPAFFKNRTQKALSRVIAMQCGGMSSNFQKNLAGPIQSVDVLDEFSHYEMPVDVLARIETYLPGMGVNPGKFVSYKQACKEGWAHQPTSRVEKIIWDQVHTIPKNPMKIEFDPKKGR